MCSFDRTIIIQAPPELVWAEVRRELFNLRPGLFRPGEIGKAVADIEKALRLGMSEGNHVLARDELRKVSDCAV